MTLVCVVSSFATGPGLAQPPPYAGTASYLYGSATTSPCAADSNRLSVPLSWHPSTGRVAFASSSTAGTCPRLILPGSGGSSISQSSEGWYLLVPVHLRNTTANQSVRATWNLSWASSVTYAIGSNCSGALASGVSYGLLDCSASSSVSFYLVGYLYDATTGGFYFSPGFFPTFYNFSYDDRDTTCTPTCTMTHTFAPPAAGRNGSTRATFRFDLVHPNASHLWEFYSVAFARTFASVTTSYQNFTGVAPLRATARASLDMGTGGRGAWLASVTVR